jgi:glyoxylase-like metal-dependent hydrolase (beta-lactamase superfamily II)
MRVAPNVHLVASGWLGFGLTVDHDCHAYLVGDADGAVLIDAGCGRDDAAIVANIAACGIAPESVSAILLTHAHADHAGGAAGLAERLGAPVFAGIEAARIVTAGDEDAAGLTAAQAAGGYPVDVRLRPVESRPFEGPVEAGGWSITGLDTPGHAAGHLAFVAEQGSSRLLFSGDLVFSRGRVAVLATPDTDVLRLATSIAAAAGTGPTALLPGHGELVLAAAGDHLAVATRSFAAQQLPPSLI